MHLGRDSAYGVFVAAHLATHRDGVPIAGDALTESCGIPAESLAIILPKLVDAGILCRDPGPPECYSLSNPPEKVTLVEIVEAIEGEQAADLMLPTHFGAQDAGVSGPRPGHSTPAAGPCLPVLKAVGSIAAALLKSHTVADLLDESAASRHPRSDGNGAIPGP